MQRNTMEKCMWKLMQKLMLKVVKYYVKAHAKAHVGATEIPWRSSCGDVFAASDMSFGIGFSMVFRCRRYEVLHALLHGIFHGMSLHNDNTNNNNKTSYPSSLSCSARTTTSLIIIELHIATKIKDAVLWQWTLIVNHAACQVHTAFCWTGCWPNCQQRPIDLSVNWLTNSRNYCIGQNTTI